MFRSGVALRTNRSGTVMQKLKVAFFEAMRNGRFTSFLSAFRHETIGFESSSY